MLPESYFVRHTTAWTLGGISPFAKVSSACSRVCSVLARSFVPLFLYAGLPPCCRWSIESQGPPLVPPLSVARGAEAGRFPQSSSKFVGRGDTRRKVAGCPKNYGTLRSSASLSGLDRLMKFSLSLLFIYACPAFEFVFFLQHSWAPPLSTFGGICLQFFAPRRTLDRLCQLVRTLSYFPSPGTSPPHAGVKVLFVCPFAGCLLGPAIHGLPAVESWAPAARSLVDLSVGWASSLTPGPLPRSVFFCEARSPC